MTIVIVENLRGFFNSRPPLVLFMICLASFAIALITFAYVVRIKDMPNPDVKEDWNTILTKFSGLEFCVSSDSNLPGSTALPVNSSSMPVTSGKKQIGERHPADVLQEIHNIIKGKTIPGGSDEQAAPSASNPTQSIPPNAPTSRVTKRDTSPQEVGIPSKVPVLPGNRRTVSTAASPLQNLTRSVTIPLNMEIAPNAELRAVSLRSVHLTAEVSGELLKLNGPGKHENMQISLSFTANLSRDSCKDWEGNECSLYVVSTCVTFSGPPSVFPEKNPASSAVCERDVPGDNSISLRNMTATELTVSGSWCSGGSRLTAEFSFDEALTVMLSQQDRSLINMHLMRTSYFLFVMVITLFCYAMIRGRPAKTKTVHVSYDKVMTSGP